MTNDEAKQAAANVRVLHKLPGVLVVSLEAEACQFGFALADGYQNVLVQEIPRVLREIAAKFEAGIEMTQNVSTLE